VVGIEEIKPDEALFDRLCVMFGKSGLIERYLELARRYEAPDREDGPGPNMKNLVKIIQSHHANAKLFSKWRVIEMCSETINGWWWTGKLVMKRYNVIEIQFEGQNGILGVGSNLSHIWGVASRLVPDVQPPSGPLPYPQIAYDNDEERLDRMMGEIVRYFDEVKDVIRRDLADFPKGTL
jgi:hypothetical protein